MRARWACYASTLIVVMSRRLWTFRRSWCALDAFLSVRLRPCSQMIRALTQSGLKTLRMRFTEGEVHELLRTLMDLITHPNTCVGHASARRSTLTPSQHLHRARVFSDRVSDTAPPCAVRFQGA